jgi:hypothetical protein
MPHGNFATFLYVTLFDLLFLLGQDFNVPFGRETRVIINYSVNWLVSNFCVGCADQKGRQLHVSCLMFLETQYILSWKHLF